MSNLIEELVPKGPPDLCFESSAFTKESFSVDQFLQDHRSGGNLETMRDDLGIYLKVLRSAMIDLINKDYADYVNLSSNLMGLDKAIGNINAPLGQLKEELLQVNQYINNAISEMTLKLEQKKALRERKRSLRSLVRVRTSLTKLQRLLTQQDNLSDELDSDIVERTVCEFSQLRFNSEKCYHLMTEQEKQIYEEMGEVVLNKVTTLMIESLRAKESGVHQLSRCLSYYIKMNKHEDIERLYRCRVVSPALEPLITKETLRSLPRGLSALYDKILNYIDNDMKYLVDITNDNIKYPGLNTYEFLLRSVWPEIESRLQVNLAFIYDAGDADTFFKRYSETVKFIEEFATRLRNDKSRKQWLSQDSLISFINKWNVPVYFQIRFQEIVRGIENGLNRGSEEIATQHSATNGSNLWKLKASEALWSSLMKCWSPDIFILAIADKMWKLMLQILSRYLVWIRQTLSRKGDKEILFLVYIYSDVETLVRRLVELEQHALSTINLPSSSSSQLSSTLHRSLEECGKALSDELISVERAIVGCLLTRCSVYLRQVSDIPRLYRRTNREAPSKPCQYVISMMEPATEFASKHSSLTPATTLWLQTVFSDLTKQYYKLVSEVLTSVQKTEESLRRLKKARDNRSQTLVPPAAQRTADDDKIRHQLLIDVTAYANEIDIIGIKRSSVEQLTDLLLLVEATQKL